MISIKHAVSTRLDPIPLPLATAIFTFGLSFFLYTYTLPQTITSFGDSDGLIAIGSNLGLAHPPGYPFYIILINIFSKLPISGSLAFKSHLLSSLIHSLTLAIISVTIINITQYFSSSKKLHLLVTPINHFTISFVSTFSLAVNYLFWQHSIVAEKYALNNFFASLIIFCTVSILIKSSSSTYYWMLLAFTFALSLFHHQTIILLLPLMLYVIWCTRNRLIINLKPIILSTFIAISIGLFSLLTLNRLNRPISWHFKPTLKGLYAQLTRQEISGFVDTQGKNRSLYSMAPSLESIQSKLPQIIDIYSLHFHPLIFLLFLSGVIVALIYRNQISKLILIGAVFTTLGVPLYIIWPQSIGSQALVIRQLLLGYIFVPVFIAFSLYHLTIKLQTRLRPNSLPVFNLLFLGLSLMLIGYKLFSTYPLLNYRHQTFTYHVYHQMLTSLPNNSLLICDTDTSCFALLYLQVAESLRPDVIITPPAYPLVRDRLNQFPNLHGFDYQDNPFLLIDYVSWNLDKRPVFAVDLHTTHRNLIGLKHGFTYYLPYGYYGQIVKTLPKILPFPSYDFEYQLPSHTPSLNRFQSYFKANVAQHHVLNAISYAKYSHLELAEKEITHAKKLAPDLPPDFTQWLSQTQDDLQNLKLKTVIINQNNPSLEQLHQEVDFSLEANRPENAFFAAQGAVILDPLNSTSRLKLAQFFQSVGDIPSATKEYQHILKYDLQNQAAIEGLSGLQTSNSSTNNKQYPLNLY